MTHYKFALPSEKYIRDGGNCNLDDLNYHNLYKDQWKALMSALDKGFNPLKNLNSTY